MCYPWRPRIDASVWRGAAHEESGLQRNGIRSSLDSDMSRFNFNSDDNRVRAWRPRGERLHPDFALQRHTTPTAGVMGCHCLQYCVIPSTDPWYHDSPAVCP
ncbi:hypothetical protein TNCV_537681 [Trichonephila clavipes]|nr:hypothetical protein TNCV_537681 [Trichonephila clavipes]